MLEKYDDGKDTIPKMVEWVRRHDAIVPDGPPIPDRVLTVTSAPVYSAGQRYRILDHNLTTGATGTKETTAHRDGRITLSLDGAGHQISFVGPGTGADAPRLPPVTSRDKLRVRFTAGAGYLMCCPV